MLKTYDEMQVQLIRSTEDPGHIIRLASDLTQKKETSGKGASEELIKFLITANHTSLLEHITTTWLIKDVSRSFLAQITRHRMASYTSASQHYQDYRDYPNIVDKSMDNSLTDNQFVAIDAAYVEHINKGVPAQEARQILPNAKAVNILWTINVRSLINFLNLRLCYRNVNEMRIFANKVHDKCMLWWPEVFDHIGPDCMMLGKCRQGRMMAQICKDNGSPWTKPI